MSRASVIAELTEIFDGKCVKCGACCKDCFVRKGFFSDIEFKQVSHYGFDSLGFLGASGCRIPPAERSYTCITHLCPETIRKIPQIERNLFAKLTEELKCLKQ